MVAIELFGIPRLRAGIGLIRVDASSIREALAELCRACPALEDSLLRQGRVHEAFRLSVNGETFVSDLNTPLRDGDALLLLSADVGG
jgi:molybdopterin converting factor small subunit